MSNGSASVSESEPDELIAEGAERDLGEFRGGGHLLSLSSCEGGDMNWGGSVRASTTVLAFGPPGGAGASDFIFEALSERAQ